MFTSNVLCFDAIKWKTPQMIYSLYACRFSIIFTSTAMIRSLSHGMHQLNSTLVEVEDRSKNSESQQHRCIEMYALNVRSYNINSADMHVTKVKAFSLHLLRYARTTAKSPKIDGVCRRHYAFARMHVWQNDRYFISTIF